MASYNVVAGHDFHDVRFPPYYCSLEDVSIDGDDADKHVSLRSLLLVAADTTVVGGILMTEEPNNDENFRLGDSSHVGDISAFGVDTGEEDEDNDRLMEAFEDMVEHYLVHAPRISTISM